MRQGAERFSGFDYGTIQGIPEQVMRARLLSERLAWHGTGPGARVLEVGVGAGDVTIMLRRGFESVTCVEPDPRHRRRTEEYLAANNLEGVRFIKTTVEQADLPARYFDHIILLNILEHLEDPVEILVGLAKSLKPDGLFHVTVPLAGSLHRHLGVRMGMLAATTELAESDISFGHYRVYTPESLAEHITAAGLSVTFRQGFYLKPLPTSMLTGLPAEIHEGLYHLGRQFPQFASYIYLEARPGHQGETSC